MNKQQSTQASRPQSTPILALGIEDREWAPSEAQYINAIISGENLQFTSTYSSNPNWN